MVMRSILLYALIIVTPYCSVQSFTSLKTFSAYIVQFPKSKNIAGYQIHVSLMSLPALSGAAGFFLILEPLCNKYLRFPTPVASG